MDSDHHQRDRTRLPRSAPSHPLNSGSWHTQRAVILSEAIADSGPAGKDLTHLHSGLNEKLKSFVLASVVTLGVSASFPSRRVRER
jgi:hypothetical protein